MSHPSAQPHDLIAEIARDLFIVRGTVPMNALTSISRNMAVLRHEGELSLIDPIRPPPRGFIPSLRWELTEGNPYRT